MNLEQLLTELYKHDLQVSIQLDTCTYIENVFNTVKSHEMYLKSNPKNKAYMPYYNRLVKILNYFDENVC